MELSNLLEGWPVELISNATEGRNIRLTTSQSIGSTLFSSDYAGFVVHHTARSRWCHNCLQYASREENELTHRCSFCAIPHYCSEACELADNERHILECNVFVHMNRTKMKNEVNSLIGFINRINESNSCD